MAMETPARIAILGAGPIGLEAALYARYLGYDVDLYERGRVAENVLRWGHLRMFTPFGANRSPLGMAALGAQDPAWQPPADDALLTGREYAERYLIPLAQSDLIADALHEHCEVLGVGREGPLKGELIDDEARAEYDFRLLVRDTRDPQHARERATAADVVIDTTGTYGQPNWLGQGGLPALGERTARAHIEYGLPDVLGAQRDRYASRNILLIGADACAATNLIALVELAGQAPDTWITWITRDETSESAPEAIRVSPNDPPVHATLAERANRLAASDANHVSFFAGTTVDSLSWHDDPGRFSVRLAGKHAGELEFDRIIANVGFHGDSSIYRELHVEECPATGAPLNLAQARREASEPGPPSLITREPDFYILGAKSYGRDPNFVIADGLEQIRQLFTIIGDRAELNLYATMAKLI